MLLCDYTQVTKKRKNNSRWAIILTPLWEDEGTHALQDVIQHSRWRNQPTEECWTIEYRSSGMGRYVHSSRCCNKPLSLWGIFIASFLSFFSVIVPFLVTYRFFTSFFFQVFPPHHSVAWFGKATGKATACHMTELCIAYINRPRSLSRSIRLPNYKITG